MVQRRFDFSVLGAFFVVSAAHWAAMFLTRPLGSVESYGGFVLDFQGVFVPWFYSYDTLMTTGRTSILIARMVLDLGLVLATTTLVLLGVRWVVVRALANHSNILRILRGAIAKALVAIFFIAPTMLLLAFEIFWCVAENQVYLISSPMMADAHDR